MPLRVSCLCPVLRLFSSSGGGQAPSSPCPACGHASPCMQACFCVLALPAVGAARGGLGGSPPAWGWGVRGRALFHARPSVFCGVQPGPAIHWLWVRRVRACGPATNPTARALGSWLCALWGRHKGARGERLLPGCGASGVRRSPYPDRSSCGACGRGPLPTACGCGGCGCGDLSPNPQRALLRAGFARCGGGTRAPGGGASCLGVVRPGSGALPPPTARPLRRAAGAHYPLAVAAGGAGVGTRHQPHSARSCELALRAVEAAQERPGGGAPLACVRGVRGRTPSHPRLPVLWGVRPGPTTHWLGPRGLSAWGPVTNPTARALASWLCALWGQHEDAWGGGGASCLGWGHPGSGVLPPPTARHLGRAARADHTVVVGAGLWAWGPGSNPTARALASWLCALWGRHEGARGGCRLPVCGASGVGRPPTPTAPALGRAAGAHYPLPVGAGGLGMVTRHKPHSARSCELALRAVGAARGRPGGGASWLGVGRPGSGALRPSTARPLKRAAGANYPLAVGAWVSAWGPVTNPTAHALGSWLCALWGRHQSARGGGAPLAWVWGVRGQALSQPRRPVLRGVRPGAHYPLAVGAGDVGLGTRHQPHSARSSEMALRALGADEGARGERLLPGCGASGVGRSPTPDRSSFGACGRGPLPTGCGCGGCGRGDLSPTPPRALLRAGFARCGGGSPTPDRPPFGACGWGPLPTGCGCAVRALGPSCCWHRLPCRDSSCVVCAYRVCGTRWPLWLGTCPPAVVVAGGVPLWRASWPRVDAPCLVRSGRSRCSGRLSRRRGAFPLPGGCRPRLYWVAARGT